MSKDLENSLVTIAKGIGTIFIGLIIGNLLGICNQILLARFLGPTEYGIYNLAISVVVIIGTFASFGLNGALPVFIPHHNEGKQKHIVKDIIDFSIKFVFASSLIIGLILWVCSEYISRYMFHESGLVKILQIFAISFPLLVLPNIFQSILRAFGWAKYKVYLYDIALPIAKIALFILFIIIGNKLYGAVAAYIGSSIIVIIASISIIHNKYFSFNYLKKHKSNIGIELLSFSWPLALTGVSFIFISKTDIVLIGHYLTPTEIGIYTVSVTIAGMLTVIGMAFEWVFLPTISKLLASRKEKELESLFKSSSKWMFIVVLPIFLFIFLYSKEIIIILFGLPYVDGNIALIIITFGISMNTLTGLTGNMLVGKGHVRLNLLTEIIGGITNIALNIILIPIYGITGAAIGTAMSYFTRNASSVIFYYSISKTHPFEKSHINIIMSGITTLLFFYLLKTQILHLLSLWISLLFGGILFFSTYGVLIVKSGSLDQSDTFIINKGLSKFILRNK